MAEDRGKTREVRRYKKLANEMQKRRRKVARSTEGTRNGVKNVQKKATKSAQIKYEETYSEGCRKDEQKARERRGRNGKMARERSGKKT